MAQKYSTFRQLHQCRLDKVPKADMKKLSIREVVAAFVVLTIGMALSLIALFIEIFRLLSFLLRKSLTRARHGNGAKELVQSI